jgi:hypothetical protein
MAKSLILLIFFIGFSFIVIGYCKHKAETTPPIIEYRYIPQSFTMKQLDQKPVRAIYSKMFNENDPWINSIGFASDYHRRKLFTYHDAY